MNYSQIVMVGYTILDTKNHRIVHLKWVSCMVCESSIKFYFKKHKLSHAHIHLGGVRQSLRGGASLGGAVEDSH